MTRQTDMQGVCLQHMYLGQYEAQGGENWCDFAQEAVKVRGMEQYMRNKQHARNLDKEQRAREQKAFLLEVKGRLNPCTIPEPFALKTELREVRTTCTSSV